MSSHDGAPDRADPADPSRRVALAALAGAVVLPDFASAQPARPRLHERRFLFGSPVDVMLQPRAGTPAGAAMTEVLAGLETLNRRWNAWKPGDVTALNQALRDGRPALVNPALLALIRTSLQLEIESFGLFNAGLGGAVQAWGFHADVMRAGARPRGADLARWRDARPSLTQLQIRGHEVRSGNPRLQLDFGAVAKGVAIDQALERLRARGIHDALVNLGGNLAAMGEGGAAPWHIGIRDPTSDGLLASLHTRGCEAVVTSGSYERFRILDGERFTHILDPQTAAPASELISVTVVHPSAARADAAATALLVAGRQRWRRVAQRLGVRDVLIVDRDGRGTVTASLARRLQFATPAWRAATTAA